MAELAIFQVLLNHPRLAGRSTICWRSCCGTESWTPGCASWRSCGSAGSPRREYEWTQHWRVAQGLGVSADDLLGVRDWQSHNGFGPTERAVLAATDDVVRDGAVSEQSWAACKREFGADQAMLVELVTAISAWRMVASILHSLRGAAGRRRRELAAGRRIADPINRSSSTCLGRHIRLTRQSPTHSVPAMRTRVADMLGVEFPICAFSHCRDVVAAVSNAGGFGVLGAVAHSPERLETELSWIEEQTGGKPYGVDLLLPPKYVGAERGGIDAAAGRGVAARGAPPFRRRPAVPLRHPGVDRQRTGGHPVASTSRPRATNRCSTSCSPTTSG